MAFPLSPNVSTLKVKRGCTPISPYPVEGTAMAIDPLKGFFKPQAGHGRFGGTGTDLHWTAVLAVDPGTDIRDGFSGHFQSFNHNDADTVYYPDYPQQGACRAFEVIYVEDVAQGTALAHRKVYLDALKVRRSGG
jgi:hypothetical protein